MPEDLSDLLKESGIDQCVCRKLPLTGKDGRTFTNAAFIVSFDHKYLDLVYSESTWPVECEVREWIYKDKNKQGSEGDK
jgi:hypothetical protein